MNLTTTPSVGTTPAWQGFHHIALVTPDLDATIRFYTDILGMQVTRLMPATDRNGRHCFIKPGESDTWGLHIFEQPDAQIFAYPQDLQRFVCVPGVLQHIAFALPGRAEGLALRERLVRFGVATTDINRIGPIENLLFRDNNGVLLEATWLAEV